MAKFLNSRRPSILVQWVGLDWVGWLGMSSHYVSCFVVSAKVWKAVLTLVHLVEAVAVIFAVDTVDLLEDIFLDSLKDYYSVEGTGNDRECEKKKSRRFFAL